MIGRIAATGTDPTLGSTVDRSNDAYEARVLTFN
jgi:hypothetical protein